MFKNVGKEQVLIVVYSLVLIAGILKVYNNTAIPAFYMPGSGKSILIDPGHGGWDPGKVDSAGRLEKDINLEIAKKLQTDLEINGTMVFTTRLSDVALAERKRADLNSRKQLAEKIDADILVSIHQNSFPDADVRGAQVFYYGDSDKSKQLAVCIQARLNAVMGSGKNRLAKPNESYYMLKKISMPSVIIECGFMSNAGESWSLTQPKYQEKIAYAIFEGIVDYFTSSDIPEG